LQDWEFVILDDGSEQRDTCAELESHAVADSRIHLKRGPARGLTRTLNRGLALAKGALTARQDADDWSEPERLERQAEFFRENPQIGLCGTNACTYQQDGRALWATRLPESAAAVRAALRRGNPFVHGSTMFRTAAARALGGYREQFSCGQDYDFFWRLSDVYGGANLPEPLYHYRFTAGAVSAGRAAEQARSHRAAQILAHARRNGAAEDVAGAWALAAAEVEQDTGPLRAALRQIDHRMLAGDTGVAGRAYAELLAAHPASRLAWGKLLRWAVFSAVPPAREWCFR
jgi:glycosyltransferase involved in cell wall biosynthesis